MNQQTVNRIDAFLSTLDKQKIKFYLVILDPADYKKASDEAPFSVISNLPDEDVNKLLFYIYATNTKKSANEKDPK